MASNRIDELLGRIEQVSEPYAHLASKLSARIDEISARLEALPGKISVSVAGDSGGEVLSFHKGPRGWALFCPDEVGDWTELRTASLRVKIDAAPLIETLLEQLATALEGGVEALTGVNSSSQRLGCAQRDQGREGK